MANALQVNDLSELKEQVCTHCCNLHGYHHCDIAPLEVDSTHDLFRFNTAGYTAGAAQYIVKYFRQDIVTPFHITETFSLQRQLAAIGLAPEPIKLHGRIWIEKALAVTRQADKVTTLAQQNARIHQVESQGRLLDIGKYIERLLASLPSIERHPFAYLAEDMQAQLSPPNQWCLCHHDLSIDHVLAGQVIDWEYASWHDPMMDLACTIVTNDLNGAEIDQFIHLYCATRSIDDEVAIVAKVLVWLPLVKRYFQLWNAVNQ